LEELCDFLLWMGEQQVVDVVAVVMGDAWERVGLDRKRK
jgi:hypothetical protein